jgi:hypothetical protein
MVFRCLSRVVWRRRLITELRVTDDHVVSAEEHLKVGLRMIERPSGSEAAQAQALLSIAHSLLALVKGRI